MNILVCGAGGFIGSNLVKKLVSEGHYVVGIDLKYPEFTDIIDNFIIGDLREKNVIPTYIKFDRVYQFAADMGGCQYIFTGENDADIMHNSASINLNICEFFKGTKTKIFYSSSACIYPKHLQKKRHVKLKESDAYPADPDSEYGWEKLFSERLYLSYMKNYGLDVRIARLHNIYGPFGTYEGGKEKAPASICKKVALAKNHVEIWGDGKQTRSFLYIDECLEGIDHLMNSNFRGPLNIGSEESVSINQLWKTAIEVSGKKLKMIHIDRPKNILGVMGRNSDNTLIEKELNWKPSQSLRAGIDKTYKWIEQQINGN